MKPELLLSTYQTGANLPELKKVIVQEEINLYAEASGDSNPIHIDEEFAKATPLGGTIAHGMLILAYISEMMTVAFEERWLTGGRINVRFKAPARPGDTVTISGKVQKVEKIDGFTSVKCQVLCQNQNEDTVITGDATVKIEGSN